MIRIVLSLFCISMCFWSCTEIQKQLEPSSDVVTNIYSERRLKIEYFNGRRDFRNINLMYAVLDGADLRDADLRFSDLRYSDLRNADLRNTDLSYAYLSGAVLRDARTNGIMLTGALGITSSTFRNARP